MTVVGALGAMLRLLGLAVAVLVLGVPPAHGAQVADVERAAAYGYDSPPTATTPYANARVAALVARAGTGYELWSLTTSSGFVLAAKAGASVVTTGQRHHVISTRIGRAIERHETLAGHYSRRDPRFITQAVDEAAHRGYQRWHRDLDEEIVRLLGQNRNVTPKQFESYLRSRYNRPDLKERFPNGF